MTLTIQLSDEQATALKSKASAEGLSVEAWIQKIAVDASEEGSRRHISQIIRDNMKDVPAEVMASMPNDGAAQHDHYVYGWPKKPE
jgi:hypothetical protein